MLSFSENYLFYMSRVLVFFLWYFKLLIIEKLLRIFEIRINICELFSVTDSFLDVV